MVRKMNVAMIVLQRQRSFVLPKVIQVFLTWIETLKCGINLLAREYYRLPA
jgi:hypothetical protein